MTLFMVSAIMLGQFVYSERPMADAHACHLIKATVKRQLVAAGAKVVVTVCNQVPAL